VSGAAGSRWRRAAGLAATLLALAPPALAERLPVKVYTTADGLAHDHVQCVLPDSRGLLWICTAQGLSRFDGRRFVTYGTADGLDELYVNDALESRAGALWVATNGGGVYRLHTDGRAPAFVRHAVGASSASHRVNVLHEDASGRIWAGTDAGAYLQAQDGRFAPVPLPGAGPVPPQVSSFARDVDSTLWVGTSGGLFRATGDRVALEAPPTTPPRVLPLVLMAEGGRIWIGHGGGLATAGGGTADLPPASALEGETVTALRRLTDGRVFVGLRGGGLGEWDGRRLARHRRAQGLSDDVITALAEDSHGNLWIGGETGGVMRLARNGFVSLDASDGLGHERVVSIFETRARELCVLSAMRFFNRYDGARFRAMRPRLDVPPATYRSEHTALQDHEGGWWIATAEGLVRYGPADGLDDLVRLRPRAVYTTRDGLRDDHVGRPYEDSRGDVWLAYGRVAALSRWERSTGAFRHYASTEGLPEGNRPVAWAESADGTLWVGFREGGLARLRHGRFEYFGEPDGLPPAMTRALHRDARGRLWAATTGAGLVRVEQPEALRPRFVRLTRADGLSSDHIRALTDDGDGALYLGTSGGVDRLDVETGAVVRYTTADGLAQNEIQTAFRDARGALWFGTMRGVSRFVPRRDGAAPPVPALIGGVSVGGVPRPLPPLGQRIVPAFEVPAGADSIRIDFFAPALAAGHALRFQYRLGGGDWSPPTAQDSVEFVALAPGRHDFEVRAAGGSAPPASVSFEVLRPVWRRWWFLALAGTGLAGLALQLHGHRLRRQLELEHVRTHIASDLHDDIGSSLTQIAILSEVAARDLGVQEASTRETLAGIARASREAVGSMSDIVWAIDPERDQLDDLVHRMRRFASDVFTARDVPFRFDGAADTGLHLGPDVRRHVFLVFKEGVHNAARHSGCRSAVATVRVEGRELVVTLKDDGRGFDLATAESGHGLASMKSRARRLGATLALTSTPGAGTSVELRVPLRGARTSG
jgi:ligand-binding sensor domain-containing protein/signal transduction histidine kinase